MKYTHWSIILILSFPTLIPFYLRQLFAIFVYWAINESKQGWWYQHHRLEENSPFENSPCENLPFENCPSTRNFTVRITSVGPRGMPPRGSPNGDGDLPDRYWEAFPGNFGERGSPTIPGEFRNSPGFVSAGTHFPRFCKGFCQTQNKICIHSHFYSLTTWHVYYKNFI